jgi:TctA family transporter
VEPIDIPDKLKLDQNYPNPFNPTTKISWQSSISGRHTLKIYDVLGNLVATLVDEDRPAGNYDITFDASSLSSGVYFYKLQIGSYIETKKMILLM